MRRDAWLEDLEQRLRDLEGKIAEFRFEDLAQNEQFVSATLVATQAALKTHQQEKVQSVKNAVLNVALGHEPDTDRQQQFLALVDRFTAAHLTLLRFFQDPAGHFERTGRPVPTVPAGTNLLAYEFVRSALPELNRQFQSPAEDRSASAFQMFQVLFDDLTSAKLISLQRVKDNEAWIIPRLTALPTPFPVHPVTTHLGEDFLAFITEPRERQIRELGTLRGIVESGYLLKDIWVEWNGKLTVSYRQFTRIVMSLHNNAGELTARHTVREKKRPTPARGQGAGGLECTWRRSARC